MRKLVLGLAITLDGFIEGPSGEYDWCFTDQDYGMSEFLQSIDAIFYGRKSYEMMMGVTMPENSPNWSDKKSYVFSNTITPSGDVTLVSGDIKSEVKKLKSMSGKDIWLFGGASLTTSLLQEGLVDRVWLSVHPILLGQGKRLFPESQKRLPMTLVSVKSYETGLVSLIYDINQ